ncbi:hypothetical protein SYNPS1DRAFT_28545 [Syncephalis pseudoplumigaleata]|uniref:Alpha/Beta hydrolase protein n=1 Tax=Syncephalis pseudoplumigaleata TaxID=1712513 RepID=A0A4V1J1P0_9FUNG|nr:hypothetical protein SYNPS1DRAFT_28545 [Syncephalis pseudoplumigaleata]|eukprot:RKP25729.1 hypothetical protein SYNPS1DRAFT_28545 [Syncephalis pseudoplumigaleata]
MMSMASNDGNGNGTTSDGQHTTRSTETAYRASRETSEGGGNSIFSHRSTGTTASRSSSIISADRILYSLASVVRQSMQNDQHRLPASRGDKRRRSSSLAHDNSSSSGSGNNNNSNSNSFLAEGETPDHFEDWMWSHRLLMLSPRHRWSGTVYGWPSGRWSSLWPRPSATIASGLYAAYLSSRGLRAVNPAAMLATLGVDAGLHVARMMQQYRQADRHARERAHQLRERLIALRCQYPCVRVVAHSLGCRHTLEALRSMTDPVQGQRNKETAAAAAAADMSDPRPDWLHLCAPACTESDVADVLAAGPARRGTFLYYTRRDIVLSLMFRTMHPQQHRALGEIGPAAGLGAYPGLHACAIDDAFGWRVHTAYARRFHQFAMAPG